MTTQQEIESWQREAGDATSDEKIDSWDSIESTI